MRRFVVVVAATLWMIGSAGVLLADVNAPTVTNVRLGSVAFEPEASGLELAPPSAECSADPPDDTDTMCSRRYAFAPDATLRTWLSVRNDGPLAVTLTGASSWIDRYAGSSLLAEPVRVSDAGNPIPEPRSDGSETDFAPIVLATGEQRLVGIEFRTTADLADACQRWSVGSGVLFASVPVEWHWLVNTHTVDLAFSEPIEFLAPTEADCVRS